MPQIKLVTLGIALLVAIPLFAHHPFSVEFDGKKPVSLSGVVTKFDWANPHAYLHVQVRDAEGMTRNWNFEMGALSALQRAGWTKDTVKPGDKVSIEGWLARSPGRPTTANMKTILFESGLQLSGASSNGHTDPRETP